MFVQSQLLWSECLDLLQHSYIQILTLKVKILVCGIFMKWLGREGGALMNGISSLTKESP